MRKHEVFFFLLFQMVFAKVELFPKLFSVSMNDLSKLLINSGIGCFIGNVVLIMCFMLTTGAMTLQELLNICHSYSISVDVTYYPLKSFCIGFTPKLFKLSLPKININSAHILYTDSINHLGFTFTSSHKDDNDIIRQMRILYACSNRIVRLFHSCSTDVLLELGRSFCGSFYCSHLWTSYK